MSEKLPIRLNRLPVTDAWLAGLDPGPLVNIRSILIPVRRIDGEALERYPAQKWLNAKITNPRNPKIHRTYFKVIALAAVMWPEHHEPFPEGDENHLRAWLQCKAGRCHFYDFPVEAKDGIASLIRDIRGDGKFAFVRVREDMQFLRVYIPDTIQYEALGEEEFRPIKEAVFEIIEQVLGVSIEALLKNAEMTA